MWAEFYSQLKFSRCETIDSFVFYASSPLVHFRCLSFSASQKFLKLSREFCYCAEIVHNAKQNLLYKQDLLVFLAEDKPNGQKQGVVILSVLKSL